MKTPKLKQPTHYDRADQMPAYTSYGWRRLQVGETIRSTDWRTSTNNPVDFTIPDENKGPGIPCWGFLRCNKTVNNVLTESDTKYLVFIRPWFPHRNPLLKPKKS